ncbi:MAG: VacJ family lipoprotein [Proteobacteria bacterium]|nr:VacJ family lipoprotein [Pseudomonadota bacterium]
MLRSLLILTTFIFFASPALAEIDEDEFETYETSEPETIYDPYEKANRKIYAFNDAFDRYFFEHVARAYRKSIPRPARDSVHNFLNNLSLPISAINSAAQGKTDNALATFSNFLINSTIGVFGLFDVAGQKGIFYKSEDFGQTLGHYGSGQGAYLMIPILGPSSARDFGGFVVDRAISPLGFDVFEIGGETSLIPNKYLFTLIALSGIDTRENLLDVVDDVRKDSFDPYATIRSAYLQRRLNEIKN